jgi:integrase
MSVQRRGKVWRVRWEDGDHWRSRTFDRKSDAVLFNGELRRKRRLGDLAQLDAGTETLDAYVTGTWAPTYAALLAPTTRKTYSVLYDAHVAPTLGSIPLRELNTETVARWQADRLAAGVGPASMRKTLALLGNLLQRAAESGRIPSNPVRFVRKVKAPRRGEVRPLASATIDAMRAACEPRDAALLSVLAYAGVRPGEALGLRWGDVRERTLLVQRAVSLGAERATKTGAHRTVRLLAPLAADLRDWRMRSGRPDDRALILPARDGGLWSDEAYRSWRRHAFRRALSAGPGDGGAVESWRDRRCERCKALARKPCRTPSGREASPHSVRLTPKAIGRPYDLRHSFASLLLHEGRNVIYVARQLGHGAQLTLSTYGHTIDELDDRPQQDAESAIEAARVTSAAHELPITAT